MGRPWHVLSSWRSTGPNPTLHESLGSNNEASKITAYFFLDGRRCDNDVQLVQEVRAIAREATCFARTLIVERERSLGLAQNVIDGVTRVLAERYGHLVEDDLFVSPAFLGYINRALVQYRATPSVYSVSGYSSGEDLPVPHDSPYDAFFIERHMCWGWEPGKIGGTRPIRSFGLPHSQDVGSWRRSLGGSASISRECSTSRRREPRLLGGPLVIRALRQPWGLPGSRPLLCEQHGSRRHGGSHGLLTEIPDERLNCRKDLSLPPHVTSTPRSAVHTWFLSEGAFPCAPFSRP